MYKASTIHIWSHLAAGPLISWIEYICGICLDWSVHSIYSWAVMHVAKEKQQMLERGIANHLEGWSLLYSCDLTIINFCFIFMSLVNVWLHRFNFWGHMAHVCITQSSSGWWKREREREIPSPTSYKLWSFGYSLLICGIFHGILWNDEEFFMKSWTSASYVSGSTSLSVTTLNIVFSVTYYLE
jgi:hypothetical protein